MPFKTTRDRLNGRRNFKLRRGTWYARRHIKDPKDVRVYFIGPEGYGVPRHVNANYYWRKFRGALVRDLRIRVPRHFDFRLWKLRGVLITSIEYWKTYLIIRLLQSVNPDVIFVLVGWDARKLRPLIDTDHTVIEVDSPMWARGNFHKSRIFSKINNILKDRGLPPVDWRLIRVH